MILVTGANGRLGRALVAALSVAYDVRAAARTLPVFTPPHDLILRWLGHSRERPIGPRL
jgi:nucleoside-diphosphate-sugar epimerase